MPGRSERVSSARPDFRNPNHKPAALNGGRSASHAQSMIKRLKHDPHGLSVLPNQKQPPAPARRPALVGQSFRAKACWQGGPWGESRTPNRAAEFQSTLPAWGATEAILPDAIAHHVSI